jgi:hypothetical protein
VIPRREDITGKEQPCTDVLNGRPAVCREDSELSGRPINTYYLLKQGL